jgi:hypothetical protein
MDVGVDESRNRDVVGRVHDLGARGGQLAADGGDPVVFDQNIAAVDVADCRVHRYDGRIFDQY